MTLNDLTLTWPDLTLSQMTKWSSPMTLKWKITHKTCVAGHFSLFQISWPFMTWPWPCNSPFTHCHLWQYVGSIMCEFEVVPSYGRASEAAGVKTCIFDLWPDLDLTFDLLRSILWSIWKLLDEIFRTPPRPSLYDHPFSRYLGGQNAPPPNRARWSPEPNGARVREKKSACPPWWISKYTTVAAALVVVSKWSCSVDHVVFLLQRW